MQTPSKLEEYIEQQYLKYDNLRDQRQYLEAKGILLETINNANNYKYDKRKYPLLQDLFSLVKKYLENQSFNFKYLDFLCSIIISFGFLSNRRGYEYTKKEIERTITLQI